MIIASKTSLMGQWFGSRSTIADKFHPMYSYRYQAKRRNSSVDRNGLAVDGEKLAIEIDEVSVKPYFFWKNMHHFTSSFKIEKPIRFLFQHDANTKEFLIISKWNDISAFR